MSDTLTAPAVLEWQPIETAPRDGTQVIIHEPGRKPWPAYYVDRVTVEYGKETRRSQHWCYAGLGGISLSNPTPTAWLPMPQPPST